MIKKTKIALELIAKVSKIFPETWDSIDKAYGEACCIENISIYKVLFYNW